MVVRRPTWIAFGMTLSALVCACAANQAPIASSASAGPAQRVAAKGEEGPPDDPLAMFPETYLMVGQARLADLRASSWGRELLAHLAEDEDDEAPRQKLWQFLLARADVFAAGMGPPLSDGEFGDNLALIAVGDFRGFREVAELPWQSGPRGLPTLAPDDGEDGDAGTMIFLDERHWLIGGAAALEAVFAVLDAPETSMAQSRVFDAMLDRRKFEQAGLSFYVGVRPEHVQALGEGAGMDASAQAIMEQVRGGFLLVQLTDGVSVDATLRTSGPGLAAVLAAVIRERLDQAVPPGVMEAFMGQRLRVEGGDVKLSWRVTAEQADVLAAQVLSAVAEDESRRPPIKTRAELAALIEQRRAAVGEHPGNTQLRADLGWSLLRAGDVEGGLAWLRKARLPPSDACDCEVWYPEVDDLAGRRERFLQLLDKLARPVDATSIELGHFVAHEVEGHWTPDPELTAELERRARPRNASPVYLDVLRALLYLEDDQTRYAAVAERVVKAATRERYEWSQPTTLGHFLYNAACGQSRLGNFEAAGKRLQEALRYAPEMFLWSQEDPDLEGLRNHMGLERFRKAFDPEPARPPPGTLVTLR